MIKQPITNVQSTLKPNCQSPSWCGSFNKLSGIGNWTFERTRELSMKARSFGEFPLSPLPLIPTEWGPMSSPCPPLHFNFNSKYSKLLALESTTEDHIPNLLPLLDKKLPKCLWKRLLLSNVDECYATLPKRGFLPQFLYVR